MKALSRLQSTVMFQASGVEGVSDKFCARAKTLVAFGVVLAAALAAQPSHAQSGPMSPSACAALGGTVGGLVGSQAGNSNNSHTIGAVLGAFGGAVAGNFLCSPKERSKDSSYDHAASYGVDGSNSVAVERHAPKMALSITERERLDDMSRVAIDAKFFWKKSLMEVDQARGRSPASMNAALERESEARSDFERKRNVFSTTVAKLNNGVDGTPPKAVGRYLEISASLLELTTESRVSFQMLEQRDRQMQERSPVYKEEADRAAAIRNRNS